MAPLKKTIRVAEALKTGMVFSAHIEAQGYHYNFVPVSGLFLCVSAPSGSAVGGYKRWEVECLDVDVQHEYQHPFAFGHRFMLFGSETLEDFNGPLDIVISVRGYSPKRGTRAGESHIRIEEKKDKHRKHPRAILLRDD